MPDTGRWLYVNLSTGTDIPLVSLQPTNRNRKRVPQAQTTKRHAQHKCYLARVQTLMKHI